MDWPENFTSEDNQLNEIHSFFDYMEIFKKNKKRETRTSYLYLADMLNFFGKDEKGHFKLFQKDHLDAPSIQGQYIAQNEIYQNLLNFKEEGMNNKFLLLIGPNGSSKSSIVKKLIKGCEEYSESPEGQLYTFSWIFPIDNFIKGTLGLTENQSYNRNLQSFAYLEDPDINAILGSDLKDHPLLLIPRNERQKIIDEALNDDPDFLESVKKSYLYRGDLSKRNKMIYDSMLKNYKGKHSDVLKHIRVERFTLSKRYSIGAVTIEPQLHVDAKLQQITMDRRLNSLPPGLQSLNLFSIYGEAIMANRGILEYSDLLKRPLDTYKYLLMTMETGNINLGGILTELDIFFIGTSNEIHLAAFRQHPDFNSFKGRFNFIRVPYLLNYNLEMNIYQKQIATIREKCYFSEDALKAMCLFAIMGRLRAPQPKNYSDKKLSEIVSKLNPLEKCLLLSDMEVPPHFDVESKQILLHGIKEVRNEFRYENLYEGKFGPSPRDVKNFIYELSNNYNAVTFVEIIEYLQKIVLRTNEFDFLNMTSQGDYHHSIRFLTLIKIYCLSQLDKKLRNSLGLIDSRSYEEHIKKYIENINSLLKNEKIKNSITGKYEQPDDFFIKEFESSINLKEEPSKFRSHLISKLGAYSLDHPGEKLVYKNVFPELVENLQEYFRKEQEKHIKGMASAIVFYEKELNSDNKKDQESYASQISAEQRNILENVIEKISESYGNNKLTAFSLVKYVIKENYSS